MLFIEKIRLKLEGKILIIFEHLNMNFKVIITFILNIFLIASILSYNRIILDKSFEKIELTESLEMEEESSEESKNDDIKENDFLYEGVLELQYSCYYSMLSLNLNLDNTKNYFLEVLSKLFKPPTF